MILIGQLLIPLLLLSSSYEFNLKSNESHRIISNEEISMTRVTSPQEYEKCPRFPGGDHAMKEFIKQKMRYPKAAKEKGVEGRVVVGFFVESDGSLTDLCIKKSDDSLLDKEALRIIKKMPKWEPGELGGKVARMHCSVPIIFKFKTLANKNSNGQSN